MINKYKEIVLNYLILLLIPLLFSLIYILFFLPNLQLDYLPYVYNFYLGGIIASVILNIIYGTGLSFFNFLVLLIYKLLLVIIYTQFLGIKNTKIKYGISIMLGLIGVLTGFLYEGMIMSV